LICPLQHFLNAGVTQSLGQDAQFSLLSHTPLPHPDGVVHVPLLQTCPP
jgi:hypothetical protein